MYFDDDEQDIDPIKRDMETGIFQQRVSLNLEKIKSEEELEEIMKKVQEMKVDISDMKIEGDIMKYGLQFVYSKIRDTEDNILGYFMKNTHTIDTNKLILDVLFNIKNIQIDIYEIIEACILNDQANFSSNIYENLFIHYKKEKTYTLKIIEKLMNLRRDNQISLVSCFSYTTEDLLAIFYVDALLEDYFDKKYDGLDYAKYKEFLLKFCSETNVSDSTMSEIKKDLEHIEDEIVNDNLNSADNMLNTYNQYVIEDYDSIIEICEKYQPENVRLLKLKNLILEWKYDDLQSEYKTD